MRFWFAAVADPNRTAAHVFTTNPMKVSTLGLMRDSASQRTMVSRSTPQARPKALVHDFQCGDLDCGDTDCVDIDIKLSPLRAQPRRESWRGAEFPFRACRSE